MTRGLDKPGSTADLPGSYEADPVGPPSGRSAIILPFRSRTAAASWDLEEEADDDCWESVGLHAVRIVGNFDRPRIHVEMSAPESPWEEEQDPPGL